MVCVLLIIAIFTLHDEITAVDENSGTILIVWLFRVQRLMQVGEQIGTHFSMKFDRMPHTPVAHALLEYTRKQYGWKKQNDLKEAMFKVCSLSECNNYCKRMCFIRRFLLN